MEQTQLEQHADAFLKREFSMPLDIPIRISKRMKSKLGAFRIKYIRGKPQDKEMEIVMSHTFISNNPAETILDVLYHECVHYALFSTEVPCATVCAAGTRARSSRLITSYLHPNYIRITS